MNSAKKQMQLARLRKAVYNSYKSLLTAGKQGKINFPDFRFQGDFVFCSDDIEDDDFQGKTYLVGKVVSEEDIGANYEGIVVRTEEGVELFEHYTERGFRPMLVIPGDKGLVANLTALEKHPAELQSYTPKQIIGLNFDSFPFLMCARQQLSDREYEKVYVSLFSKVPLFF